jgi:hypothetical protein
MVVERTGFDNAPASCQLQVCTAMSGDRTSVHGLLVAATLAGGLAGCSANASVSIGSSALSVAKMSALVRSVTRRQGLPARSVSCPAGIGLKKGRVSYCTARYADGETSRFSVRQTNGSGAVYVSPAEMTAPAVEQNIRLALRRRGITATASCPKHVPIVVGNSFVCTVRDASQTVSLPIKITDSSGGWALGTTSTR